VANGPYRVDFKSMSGLQFWCKRKIICRMFPYLRSIFSHCSLNTASVLVIKLHCIVSQICFASSESVQLRFVTYR
jgi:hypothetical protein